jgi:dinuclear metal center YbgI/SA1388 family protein
MILDMELMRLVAELDDLLEAEAGADYCPNGLQVEGRAEVERIVTAVSASRQLFEQAVEQEADLVLVHHGILWNSSEPPRLVGSFRERVRLLLAHDISLVAYHLPLDRHPELGNAAQLGQRLGLDELEPFGEYRGVAIGVCGVFPEPVSVTELSEMVAAACRQEPQLFPGCGNQITSVGIVTGGGEREYHRAVEAGLDAFITGEATEWVMHQALEDGVHYLAAGHYATERFGIRALSRWLQEKLDLEVTYIDIPNPV